MKRVVLLLVGGLMCFSCIRQEEPNSEADIEECLILNGEGVEDPNIKGNIVVTNTQVMAQATPMIDLSKLCLKVKLTEGATITPDPGELKDYSKPQSFTVTSEDGEWKKEYRVSVDTFDLPTQYSFERTELNSSGKYDVFYETVKGMGANFRQDIWASGNGGFALTGVGKKPEEYPTVSILDGVEGRGVRLETKGTGAFGETVKMPIAAGNLFVGSFDVKNALNDAMKATRFGLPFGKKPQIFKGYYKCKRGEVLADVGEDGKIKPIKGEDSCDIYAVLYESEGLEQRTLDGANVLNSPNIVALARLENPTVHAPGTDLKGVKYEKFEVEFDYKKPFEVEKSRTYKYNLAVVFTSSVREPSLSEQWVVFCM